MAADLAEIRIWLRGLLAVILGSLAPGALVFFTSFGAKDFSQSQGRFLVASLFTGGAFFFVMIVGFPAHLFLQSRNWTGYRHYMVAGAILGLALGFLMALAGGHENNRMGIVATVVLSTVSAAGFRLGFGKLKVLPA